MILSQMETQFICRHQSLKKAEYTRSKLKGGVTGLLEQKDSLFRLFLWKQHPSDTSLYGLLIRASPQFTHSGG